MAIMTYDELLRRGRLVEHRLIKAASEHAKDKTVFLSYSSHDAAYVAGAVEFFAGFRAGTYVDKDDSELPDPPSVKTASTLAENIAHCPRLVVLVSERTKSSRC
jgi:hypothetical protein